MASLPWHQSTLDRLNQLMETDRLPHALLLRGRLGDGLLEAALAAAALRLCPQPVGARPCASCKSCLLLRAGSHPDLLLLQPEDNSRVIRIDAVRDLVRQFAHTAQIGAWKVAVLHPANQLNLAAANALLKTLEEPSGQSLLILTAEQHARLLPTLQSRCQVLTLPRPSPEQTRSWLAEQGLEVGVGVELLQATGGEPLRALQWHEAHRLQEWREFLALLPDLASGRLRLSQAGDALSNLALNDLLDWYLGFLHQRLREQVEDPAASRALLECVDQALAALSELQRGTNPNPQLLTESLLMQWQRVGSAL